MSTSATPKPAGFDAAIKRREDDHLKRWSFAREIYGITVTGPQEWSVRVGIYGEWGTGKTSVLEFIAQMATDDGHVLIHFNPWEHSSKQALWNSFVDTVYDELERRFGKLEDAGLKRRRVWLEKAKEVTKAAAGVYNENLAKLVGSGLDLLKENFGFDEQELKALKRVLNGKRIVVLTDDLDRTAPELVPEILFALKELMDIAGFSFVCAFDPAVVGEVLGKFHPGFGNGLKFLEKIIDYPRWLPPADTNGLVDLAIADSKNFAPYVPELAIRDVVPLLPPNPRAIRQFIRLLALLRPQVERHYANELRWQVILTANAIKVRYPQLADGLLTTRAFWDTLQETSFGAARSGDEGLKKREFLARHTEQVALDRGVSLQDGQRLQILSLLEKLCSAQNILVWLNADNLSYQMNIAEAPHAVTWKEYDEFLLAWEKDQKPETLQLWIQQHEKRVSRLPLEIYQELFSATVTRYAQLLHDGDTTLTNTNQAALIASATSVFRLLDALSSRLQMSNLHPGSLQEDGLEFVFQKFASVVRASGPVHSQFRTQNNDYLPSILDRWNGDIMPLVKVLKPYHHFPPNGFEHGAARNVYNGLKTLVLSKLAKQIVQLLPVPEFGSRVFTEEIGTDVIRRMLIDPQSALWIECKDEVLTVLKEAPIKPEIQDNIYDLLRLFDYNLNDQPGTEHEQEVKTLLAQQDIREALWAATTATRLTPLATAKLYRITETLKRQGHSVPYPAWWDENIQAATAVYGPLDQKSPPTPPDNESPPEEPQLGN